MMFSKETIFNNKLNEMFFLEAPQLLPIILQLFVGMLAHFVFPIMCALVNNKVCFHIFGLEEEL